MGAHPHSSEWVLDLIHQGLLPLPQRTLLTARLVCRHWRDSLSQDISHLTLPYDAWGTFSSGSSARLANLQAPEQTGWRSAATAAMAAVREAAGNEEAEADTAPAAPRRKQQGNRGSKGGNSSHTVRTATNTLEPDADNGGGSGIIETCRADDATQQQQQPVQSSDADMVDALGPSPLQQGPADTAAAAAAGAAASKLDQQQQQHPLHQLPTSLPKVAHITLNNRRSAWFNPQAACGAAAVAATVAVLSQLPHLHTLTVQGYMTGTDWQPLLAEMAGPQHTQSEQQQQQELGLVVEAAQETPQGSEQQQQEVPQQQLVGSAQQLGLCTQLVCLDLQQLELPPPLLLESVLLRLTGLRSLRVHASIDSILEGAHLEALSSGVGLTSLVLQVYQAAHSRCPLDPLMALTALQHLEVAYGGIFNDQRPVLVDPPSMSRLVHLTSLASSGLAQPLLPQPNITSLRSLRVAGLTKRLPESAVQLISSCNSSSLRELRLEAGRRGIAAVAADQLDHLGFMSQLTGLRLALSKGGLPAGKSARQLEKLSGLTGLKTLWLGSGDHRLGLSTEQLQELGGQWPALDSLRLSGFSPLQGFAGLGAFTGLTALSLKPGVGTGKLLLELDVALQQLSLLRRLHLDFRSALQLEHVEALAAACSSRLQHLSLNMWAPGIGSKALVAIGQLSVLTSLQLMNMRAAVLSGPPGIAALRKMDSLELLCVQAADEVVTEQQPLELGAHLSEVLTGHCGPLREVRVWLGSGVEARQAEAAVAQLVEASLPDCRCRLLKEPEKAML